MPAAMVDLDMAEHSHHQDLLLMRPDCPLAGNLEQALDCLVAAAKLPAKQRDHPVHEHIDAICGYAYQYGLQALTLKTILETVTRPNSLDQASRASLIKALYPADRVCPDLICIAVSSLGPGKQKLSPSLQPSLIKWIIRVYDILEDDSILSKLYGVFFNMLDMISLRPTLCHLLVMITRRKHVRPFRVQMLRDLSKRIGSEPALTALIRRYENYYPEALGTENISRRAAKISRPDTAWSDRVWDIQRKNATSAHISGPQVAAFQFLPIGIKKLRSSSLSKGHPGDPKQRTISLRSIDRVDDFVNNLDDVCLPDQVVLDVDNSLLQKCSALNPKNAAVEAQLDEELTAFLDEQLEKIESGQDISKILLEVLKILTSYARYSKTLPRPVTIFLETYLKKWNRQDCRDSILLLLSYSTIQPFEELQSSILNNLENAILDNTPESSILLLSFYTNLLRHWTARILSISPASFPTPSDITTPLTSLIAHASLLSLSLTSSYPPTLITASAILTYYETLAAAVSQAPSTPLIPIITPLPQTIYLLTFLSPSLSTLSRLCSILAIYKRAFEAAMARPPPSSSLSTIAPYETYPRAYVAHFNGFLMDICNLLWRSRAFNTTDTNALGCLLPPSLLPPLRTYASTLDYTLAALFSLSQNPTLSALSIAAFRDLEDAAEEKEEGTVKARHAGPVGQRSLAGLKGDGGLDIGWPEYRLEVLRWLEERGVEGVGELMFCTMKHLMEQAKGGGVV